MQVVIAHTMRAFMPTTRIDGAEIYGLEHADIKTFLLRLRQENGILFYSLLSLVCLVFILIPILTIGYPLPSFLLSKNLLNKHTEAFERKFRTYASIIRLAAGMCWGSDPTIQKHLQLEVYPPDSSGFRTS